MDIQNLLSSLIFFKMLFCARIFNNAQNYLLSQIFVKMLFYMWIFKNCFHGFSFLYLTFNLEGVVLWFWNRAWAPYSLKWKDYTPNFICLTPLPLPPDYAIFKNSFIDFLFICNISPICANLGLWIRSFDMLQCL